MVIYSETLTQVGILLLRVPTFCYFCNKREETNGETSRPCAEYFKLHAIAIEEYMTKAMKTMNALFYPPRHITRLISIARSVFIIWIILMI